MTEKLLTTGELIPLYSDINAYNTLLILNNKKHLSRLKEISDKDCVFTVIG